MAEDPGLTISRSTQGTGAGSESVYLLLLTGELESAQKILAGRYPDCRCVVLERRVLREAGWRGQIRILMKIRGRALVFFVRSLSELQEPQLTVLSGLIHGCDSTVLADSNGSVLEYSRWEWLRILPKSVASAILDLFTFAGAWILLGLFRASLRPVEMAKLQDVELDLAYLCPYPLDSAIAGGSLTHTEGFLTGVASCKGKVEIFSGRPLRTPGLPQHSVPRQRKLFLFRESFMLSYNLRFARVVRKLLRNRTTGALYQRHGRFVVAGALLSRALQIPLILEYNASELRMASYGDPVRFRSWLRLCEETSLLAASLIAVVSEPLRQELIQWGIPERRILLNPNAVDPDTFRPGCGGHEVRDQLNIAPSEIVVAFVGTFSYWHGIRTLESAIRYLLSECKADPVASRLRFLLIGDGPLCSESREVLGGSYAERVLFTGLLVHEKIPSYLDAADILVSPHAPMQDGKPFFGSPTKLFEYMAMAKAIVASNLDQLSQVLRHDWSAWMVEPGNPGELASAILLLARDPALRERLGQNARRIALQEHTWQQNAAHVLSRVRQDAGLASSAEHARGFKG